jgi:carbon starvation protein
VWLRQNGRPYLYTLLPMLFVAIATVLSMLGEVQSYYAAFSERWLLAVMGTLILAFDIWVILEGFKVLLSDTSETAPQLET